MVDEKIRDDAKRLLDAITKYSENESRLKSFQRFYEQTNPDIAERIDEEIKKIVKVRNDLEFAYKQLIPTKQTTTSTPRPPHEKRLYRNAKVAYSSDKVDEKKAETVVLDTETEERIKKAGNVSIDSATLQKILENTTQTRKNTSNSKRNMFITGAISFLAGIFSTLVIQYFNNLNGA